MDQVNIIGCLLTGPSEDWYHHMVKLSDYRPEGWTTLEVIQGLQTRFMTQRSAADAVHEFRTITQGHLKAQELYEQLKLLSNQLPYPADAFTFAQRYMAALHPPIRKRVIMNGFNATYNYDRIEELVANAVDVEMTIAMTLKDE